MNILRAIFVQLTTACNAECVTCPHRITYGRNGAHTKGVMSDDVWFELLDQISHAQYCGQIGLYLHHEPLLVKSLERKIRDVNSKTSAFVTIATNAALLDEERCGSLVDARPRRIHVNICSADREQYENLMPGLNHSTTFSNVHRLIKVARERIGIVISCPVTEGVDTEELKKEFPGTRVNASHWANSRGGLVSGVSRKMHNSRFLLGEHCTQPTVNFNVLWDGSVIICCQDWEHESKNDFPNIMEQSLFETYGGMVMKRIRAEFQAGDYSRYKMCDICAKEMGFH